MTVNKLTYPAKQNEVQQKINEIIDNLGTASGANIDLSNLSATGEAHFQVPLVSGTNIKTINNQSILGSGNLDTPYRNIGEIVSSTIPLTDAGLHLLDGALISGSGSYSDFVDYIADLYDESSKTPNVNIVGSPTINNGVVSGFSSSNYLEIPFYPSSINSFEMQFKFTTPASITTSYAILGQSAHNRYTPQISLGNNEVGTYVAFTASATGSTWDSTLYANVNVSTTYIIRVQWNGTTVSGSLLDEDGELISALTVYEGSSANLNSVYWTEIARIGLDVTTSPFSDSIDLNKSYININGSRYWDGMQPSWATDETQWQSAVASYGVCGKFVYDSVNNTVRLPKITGIIEGSTSLSALGDLVQAGLPNITGQFDTRPSTSSSYTYGAVVHGYDAFNLTAKAGTGSMNGFSISSSTNNPDTVTLDASRSSSIYGNSTTVQPQTIKVLYYIVIATTTKTEIEVDIDEIATDLNGKADTDLSNINSNITSIPPTSLKNLDGQWIPKYLEISTATSATSRTHDLSSYLPNDGYNYEVFIRLYVEYGSSSAVLAVGTVDSPYTNRYTDAFIALALAGSNSRSSQVNVIIPINGRTLYSQNSAAFSSAQIHAYGYRRIGTNQ